MDKIKNVYDIKGKTVEKITFTNATIAIVFTDKSYIFLEGEEGYRIEVKDNISSYELFEAGIITEEEYEKTVTDRKNKEVFDHQQKELSELDRLKRKYEAP